MIDIFPKRQKFCLMQFIVNEELVNYDEMCSVYRPSVLSGWAYVKNPLLLLGFSSLLLHHVTKPFFSHYKSYTRLYTSVQNANSATT